MGLFDSELDIEGFSKSEIGNKKCFDHYFQIGFSRLEDETDKQLEKRVENIREEILGYVLGQMTSADSKKVGKDSFVYLGNLDKKVSIKVVQENKNDFYFLIRFPDIKKNEKIKEGQINYKITAGRKKEGYMFTPYESYLALNILPNVELGLRIVSGIEPHKEMTNFHFSGNNPTVTQFNGLQFFSYNLEDRFKIYDKFPEMDKILFGGKGFKRYIKWILRKRKANDHMRKYCEKVKELIDKYNV